MKSGPSCFSPFTIAPSHVRPLCACGDPHVAGAKPTRCFSRRSRAFPAGGPAFASHARSTSIPVECTMASNSCVGLPKTS